MREMLEGGDARRAHRRLPRRADHADPRPRPAQGPVARLRAHLRRARSRTASASPWSGACGSSPTPAGLNPAGLAGAARASSPPALGLSPAIAHVEGDDLARRRASARRPLTANAYLGAFGIAAALARRRRRRGHRPGHRRLAGRRAGRRAASAGRPTAYDELAGAVVAGHVLECGAPGHGRQLLRLPLDGLDDATGSTLGFPLAEIAADGSSRDHQARRHRRRRHRRHRDRAADVRDPVDARTSAPTSPPDLDTVRLDRRRPRPGADLRRARAARRPSGSRSASTSSGGYRNSVEFVLTGLDIEEKAAWVAGPARAAASRAASVDLVARRRCRPPDADTEEGASTPAAVHGAGPVARRGRPGFSGAAVELALASYPGFTLTAPPGNGTPYGVYRAGVRRPAVGGHRSTVHPLRDGRTRGRSSMDGRPLGTFVHARSGDKGGDANLGLWVAHDAHAGVRRACRLAARPRHARTWSATLLPEAADLDVEVFALPNLGGVNVVLHGLLGEGVAASHPVRPAGQGRSASGLRSRLRRHPGGAAVSRRLDRPSSEALRDTGAASSSAARWRRTSRSGRTPARCRASCTARPRSTGCSGSRSPRRSAARAATLLDSIARAGGDVRGGRLERADGRRCSPAASRCRTSRRPGTPTWSTASSGRPWPAR